MDKSGRNERVMQLRHRGQTYAEIGRDPQVNLGERQVQRIVKTELAQREEDLATLRAKLVSRDSGQTDYQRAIELLEILESSFTRMSAVAHRYDVNVSDGFGMGVSERRFEPACTELRDLLRGLQSLDEDGLERH